MEADTCNVTPCATISGQRSRGSCRAVTGMSVARHQTIDCSSMPSYIGIEPASRGAIFLSATASGSRRTSASADGAKVVFLLAFWRFWPVIQTRSTCQSTRPLCVHISTVPAPKKNGEDQAIGRSRGGLTTKIHAIVDALGNPVALSLTPGQAHDITQAVPLLDQVEPEAFLADKGYDSDALVETLKERGITPVIPSKANRKVPRKTDFALYRERNLVERFFCKIKQYRAISTRYDKLANTFLAAVALVCILLWLN